MFTKRTHAIPISTTKVPDVNLPAGIPNRYSQGPNTKPVASISSLIKVSVLNTLSLS